MDKPDKEVIRKQDSTALIGQSKDKKKAQGQEPKRLLSLCLYGFSIFVRCSFYGKRTFLFSADSRYNIGEGRAKTL